MSHSYSQEKSLAIAAVTQAADLCVRVRSEMVEPGTLQKNDRSPVTIADFGAQALVCRQIKAAFPNDAIVGEEDSTELRQPENAERLQKITDYVRQFVPAATSDDVCGWIDAGNGKVGGRYWTLDPIDGTKGFLRNDQYAIALALVEDGVLKVGALACPALPVDLDSPEGPRGMVFIAVRGQGAEMAPLHSDTFTPARVADPADDSRARFVESVESGHSDHALQQEVARAAGITRPSLRLDSQAKYGTLARGDAALYLRLPSPKSPDYRENIWDHAGGALIVEEAGGRVTDMHGQPLDFGTDYKMRRNQGVVVSNGPMHDAVIQAIARAAK